MKGKKLVYSVWGLAAGAILLVGTQAGAVSYTVAQLQGMTVNAALTDVAPGTLIAGPNMDKKMWVGSSLQNGTSYWWPNDKTRAEAASAADNRWIQTGNDEVWDLGGRFASVAVSNGYDHDRSRPETNPVLWLEALEWTAWGSNNATADFGGASSPGGWELGMLSTIYAQGWDTTSGALYDDYLGVVSFSQEYRYIHVIAQDSISIDNHTSSDNEIDWVGGVGAAPVPEPSSMILLGSGLLGVVARKRRKS